MGQVELMLQLVRQENIFGLPAVIPVATKNRMIRLTENSPGLDAPVIEIISSTVCLASLDNRPIFTSATLIWTETFTAHCLPPTSSKTSTIGKDHRQTPNPKQKWLDRLWDLHPKVMTHTRDTLTRSETPILLYKALQFRNEDEV